MRRLVAMLAGALCLSAAAAAQPLDSRPILQVGVYSPHADGVRTDSAYTTPSPAGTLDSRVYSGGCALGAGYPLPPVWAMDGWRVVGHVLNERVDEVTVQLDWQRFVADREPVTSPGGSVRLTLKNGDRRVLDSVAGQGTSGSVQGASGCLGGRTVNFEVRFAPGVTGDNRFAGRGGGGRSGTALSGVGRAGLQTGVAVLTGTVVDNAGVVPGATVTATDVATSVARSVATSDQGAFQITSLAPSRYTLRVEKDGFSPLITPPFALLAGEIRDMRRLVVSATGAAGAASFTAVPVFDVELWLIHRAPNREDETQHQTVRASLCAGRGEIDPRMTGAARLTCDGASAPTEFKFEPIRIVTPQGELNASVLGSIGIGTTAGTHQLVFTTDRRVAFVPSNKAARDQLSEAQGGGRVSVRLPGPGEVLSFEMPPLRVPSGGPVVGDSFAVRVRVTAAKSGS